MKAKIYVFLMDSDQKPKFMLLVDVLTSLASAGCFMFGVNHMIQFWKEGIIIRYSTLLKF